MATLEIGFDRVFIPQFWSSLVSFTGRELPVHQASRYPTFFHSNHVSNPSKLGLDDGGLYAGGLSLIEDLQIGDVVLPPDSQDGAEGLYVEQLQFLDMPAIQCPRLVTIEEGGKNHGIVDFQFRRLADVVFTDWLRTLPSAWLALLILVSFSLSKDPSQDMVLPRYLKCSTLASGVLSMVTVGEGEGNMVQVSGAPPSFRDWLSGRRAWMPQRSGPASAASLVLRGPLVRSRQQREPLRGEFAGSSSLLWVDAGRRGNRPSGNECRPPLQILDSWG